MQLCVEEVKRHAKHDDGYYHGDEGVGHALAFGALFLDFFRLVVGKVLGGGLLHHVHAAEIHAEEGHDVALVLVGIIHIGDEQDGLAGIAVAGVRDGLQAELFGFKGLGGPQRDGVALAVGKRLHGFGRLHVDDVDVTLVQAKDVQPAAQHVVSGRALGDDEGLPAHGSGIAVHFRAVGVKTLHFEDGAVGTRENSVGSGFVVADADDVQAAAQRSGQRGHGANAGNGPIGRLHFVNDVFTGFKGQQFEIQPFSLVPSLFSGVPDQKRFMLAEPCRAKRHKGLGERCGAAQAPRDHKKQGQQTSKGIAHFHDFLIHP